jgi:hypothetical protein
MIALARWLLRRMLPRDVRHDVLADLDAEFAGVRPVRSRAAAAAWYWRQVLGSLGPALAMRVRRAGRLARDAGQDARIGLRRARRCRAVARRDRARGRVHPRTPSSPARRRPRAAECVAAKRLVRKDPACITAR